MFENIFVNKLVIALSLKLKSFMEMDFFFFFFKSLNKEGWFKKWW